MSESPDGEKKWTRLVELGYALCDRAMSDQDNRKHKVV